MHEGTTEAALNADEHADMGRPNASTGRCNVGPRGAPYNASV
jgi:hypothetical protein